MKKKWKVEIAQGGHFEGLFQIWDKNGNAPSPAQEKDLRRQIQKFLNK